MDDIRNEDVEVIRNAPDVLNVQVPQTLNSQATSPSRVAADQPVNGIIPIRRHISHGERFIQISASGETSICVDNHFHVGCDLQRGPIADQPNRGLPRRHYSVVWLIHDRESHAGATLHALRQGAWPIHFESLDAPPLLVSRIV